ncbi:hypothetical protein [Chryseobacterium sp. JK1]|uniref:hypothetical protein n=1 Tax=Chryseobacterium sp. JK1 TaxID=874294 RepID=UPI003D69958E
MNKIQTLAVLFFFFCMSSASIPNNHFNYSERYLKRSVQQGNKDIDDIKAEYKKINGMNLKTKSFKYEDLECVDEGETAYFMKGNDVRKIVEKYIKGDGYTLTEYYFKEGKFIFAVEAIVGGPAMGPETKSVYRYYAKDDKAIRQIDGKQIVTPDSKFEDALKRAYQLTKARTAPNFNEAICTF